MKRLGIFPAKGLDLVECNGSLIEDQHRPISIGEVRIAGQVGSGFRGPRGANPFDKADFGKHL